MIDLQELQRKLVDEGKLIEAGWISLRIAAIPEDAPQVQIDEMRKAFYAGAQHLFGAINSVLDPGEEPTEADLRRMEQINDELNTFVDEMKLRGLKTKGTA